MAKNKRKSKKGISCLGALLIVCMLVIAGVTVSVNLMFRNGKTPNLLNKYYCYYTQDDMGDRVPAGSLVIAEERSQILQQDTVLYLNEQQEYRIAVASLIVDSSATDEEKKKKTYYLTTVTNTTAVPAEEKQIIGVCTNRSSQLGLIIGLLTGTIGIAAGLVLPCLILLLYLIAVIASSRDHDLDFEDEDTDLAFVKSIQQKQQKIAERDAERIAKEKKKTQTFDDGFYDDDMPRKNARLSEEEASRLEEEEAARRAERIAAVRTHMEQRRQTETPDGVPLYTTEIITKTHTLSIPKVGDKPLTNAEKPLKPTPTEDIPRLTATGHIQIPSAQQIEEEKIAQENRLRHAAALAKAAQDAAFSMPQPPKKEEPQPEPAKPAHKMTVEDILNEGRTAPAPEKESAPKPAAEAPAEKPAAPAAAPEAASAPQPAKKPAKKSVKKPQIASSSFGDLMAFLDSEQKKL